MLPEEALHLLPEDWRNSFQSMADNGRAALETVEKELLQLSRISNSFTSLVALKHAQKRLSEYKFDTNMDAIMELDMLTTAFVVAYVRLHQAETAAVSTAISFPKSSAAYTMKSSTSGTRDLRTTTTIAPFRTQAKS